MKKNTEEAILAAFQEMVDAGLPIEEFDPDSDVESFHFDWRFSRGITKKEQRQAMRISAKYIDAEYSFPK